MDFQVTPDPGSGVNPFQFGLGKEEGREGGRKG